MIIGLSGYARSGKDEAARGLERIGFQRRAFADKLREFLFLLDPVVLSRPGDFGVYQAPANLKHVIEEYGWDGYKDTSYGPHIREYLQRLGTECGRGLLGDNVWIDATLNPLEYRSDFRDFVVTDCRFPNEAQAIKDRGGIVVRVNRPGVGPANGHASENSLDDWDFDMIIDNTGTIEDLHRNITTYVV